MAKVKNVQAREIIDSRGNPTVECRIELEDGAKATSSVPSGASRGKYEAVELRDNDRFRYRGLGVLKAVNNINQLLAPLIVGQEADQKEVDQRLIEADGTPYKAKIGGNAILAVSMAVCEANAQSLSTPTYRYIQSLYQALTGQNPPLRIPTPVFNLINGGKHGAGNNLDFQEYLLIPVISASFAERLRMTIEVVFALRKTLNTHHLASTIGDEGGYAPSLADNQQALALIQQAVNEASYRLGEHFSLGLDVAGNNLFRQGAYRLFDHRRALSRQELTDRYRSFIQTWGLIYLEDPYAEDDWSAWSLLARARTKAMLVGDDLLGTNVARIRQAIAAQCCQGAIIKPNQVGTISESLQAVGEARRSGLKAIVSHRSGETLEDFIADFAVGTGAEMVKFGAPVRGERVAKYNRLLEIEKELAPAA